MELVLDALGRWEQALAAREGAAPTSRFRRRRSSTPTPYVMDLTPDELARLDGLARSVGLNRSALVRQLILLESEQATASAG